MNDIVKNKLRQGNSYNLLFLINQIGGGGAERVTVLLANYFADMQNSVVLAEVSPGACRSYSVSDKVHLVSLCDSSNSRPVAMIKRLTGLHKLAKDTEPDL